LALSRWWWRSWAFIAPLPGAGKPAFVTAFFRAEALTSIAGVGLEGEKRCGHNRNTVKEAGGHADGDLVIRVIELGKFDLGVE